MIDLIIDSDWLADSGLVMLLWSSKDKDKHSEYFNDVGAAKTRSKELSAEGRDVYFGLGLGPNGRKDQHKRFKADEVKAITAIWLDADYGFRDNGKKYPDTSDEALQLIRQIFLQPSLIVDSGGGFHVYWLLKEPWVFETDAERKQAHRLVASWQDMIQGLWRKSGYSIDSTKDLARVLRVPGTMNHKYGKEVQVYSKSEYSYNPSDFEQFINSSEEDQAVVIPVPEINIDLPLTIEEVAAYNRKFMALMDEDKDFFKTYYKRRKNLGDGSLSAYDVSLARRAVDAGFSDNEIVYLIISFRTLHGGLEKCKRKKYLQDTIRFARESAGKKELVHDISHNITRLNLEIDQFQAQIANGELNDVDEAHDTLAMLKRELLDTASSKFAVTFIEVKKYPFDPDPEFEIITDRGPIYLGKIENVLDFKLFKRKVAGVVGVVINPVPAKEWDKYAQAILHATETVGSMPIDSTDAGTAREWVGNYFNMHKKPARGVLECCARGGYYIRKGGGFSIAKEKFIEWLRLSGEKSSDRAIYRKMKRAGFKMFRSTYSPDKGITIRAFEGFTISEQQRKTCLRYTGGRQDDMDGETDREGGEDIRSEQCDGDELHEGGGCGAGEEVGGADDITGDDRHAARPLLPDAWLPDDSGDEGEGL
jgi:hypothetical protein